MSASILHQNIVLVLNRNWQAINTKTPAEAFCQMATDAATALDIQGADFMVPTKWDDWQQLRSGKATPASEPHMVRSGFPR
ncbi:MAG: hypothetical protein P1U85_23040 [Verrucomicrobiales bacterium]|nr:hypothetical protein [Verrucomicrobiales bacterium]